MPAKLVKSFKSNNTVPEEKVEPVEHLHTVDGLKNWTNTLGNNLTFRVDGAFTLQSSQSILCIHPRETLIICHIQGCVW